MKRVRFERPTIVWDIYEVEVEDDQGIEEARALLHEDPDDFFLKSADEMDSCEDLKAGLIPLPADGYGWIETIED